MNSTLLLCLLLQDLQSSADNTAKQTSYAFSFDKSGGKGKGRGAADIEGVYASGAVYLKSGTIELIRTSETTMVRLEGGDWKSFAEASAELKKSQPKEDPDPKKGRAAPPELSLEDLSRIAAPHQLLHKIIAQMRKPTPSEENGATVVKGELSDTYSRDVLKTEWFRMGDERDWSEATGALAVTHKEKLVSLIEFTMTGKLLPENPRNMPRPNPNNPRQAGRMGLQDGNATLRIRLEDFGSAKLPIPDELVKKLGLKK